jgi:hypothetical protein
LRTLSSYGTAFALSFLMPGCDIRLEELVTEAGNVGEPVPSTSDALIALRFRIEADPESLEGLRHARRSLLKEEATRGLDPDEPSLQQATFSPGEIMWEILPAQRTRCLEKLEELLSRARRACESPVSFSDTLTRRSTRT